MNAEYDIVNILHLIIEERSSKKSVGYVIIAGMDTCSLSASTRARWRRECQTLSEIITISRAFLGKATKH